MAGLELRFRRILVHALWTLLLFAGLVAASQEFRPEESPDLEGAQPAEVVPARAIPRGVRIIEIKGTIRRSLTAQLRAALEGVDAGRFPAGAVVLLDSPGGDGLAAMEVGRLLRAGNVHVFARGRCTSACIFVLAGGVVRGAARDAHLSVHRPRLTTFVKGLGVVDINTATSPKAAMALDIANRRAKDYFAEMGMPEALYTAMMAAPTDQPRVLEPAELESFGLSAIEPGYRESRVLEGAQKFSISVEEFERRQLQAPALCLAGQPPPRDFIRCYRRVLQTGA